MAVHKIKAKDDKSPKKGKEQPESTALPRAARVRKTGAPAKRGDSTVGLSHKRSGKERVKEPRKPLPTPLRIILAPFIFIAKPFRIFGRYVHDSWLEIRQVRWPDRKLTWKMTLAVIVYVIIFAVVIMLLDMFFAFLFNKLLGA